LNKGDGRHFEEEVVEETEHGIGEEANVKQEEGNDSNEKQDETEGDDVEEKADDDSTSEGSSLVKSADWVDVQEGADEVESVSSNDMPSPRPVAMSAIILDSSLWLGNPEASFMCDEAHGDVTAEFGALLRNYPLLKQAFRFGRLLVHHGLPSSTAVVNVFVTNDGTEPWPETTALQIVSGPNLELPYVPLGPVSPGETAQFVMDLTIGPGDAGEAALSAWAMVDAQGQPFGPVMLLEVVRI
jgi:hypothetical protein